MKSTEPGGDSWPTWLFVIIFLAITAVIIGVGVGFGNYIDAPGRGFGGQ